MSGEQWRPVVGFEGLYEISSLGRLKRIGKACGSHVGRILRERDGGGWSTTRYVSYTLWRNNRPVSMRAHTLVFMAFVGPVADGCEINHRNSNKQDNRPENLESVSHLENMRHAKAAGALKRGEEVKQARLTEADVRRIREMYKPREMGCIRVGKLFGVNGVTVWKIVTRRSWAHL